MNAISRFGPALQSDGVTFRLWAPAAKRVDVILDQPHEMASVEGGWYEATIPGVGAGALYKFRVDGNVDVPDPASRFQPADVYGPSQVVDHAYAWRAADWRGRPWTETVLLELHVGAFTPRGTYRGAIEKLDLLVETGFTAIELMPLSDFAGQRNWGYDGVLPFAPDNMYGRPDDLKALIDAAHQRGLMVFLDVVYNHFGPEGNYLARYAPQFFTEDHSTPWGAAIDYRVPEVRAFAIENAMQWVRDYRFDGLRLDAVHAIVEPGEPSILHDISEAVGAFAAESGRHIHLVLENDDNRVSLLDPLEDPPRGKYRAQWNDDFHHILHVLLTGETSGYYSDHAHDARGQLVRVLQSGFAYQGDASLHRGGAFRGEPSGGLPASAFVSFLQNHDQIGNRPFGDRLTTLASPAAIEAALAIMLLAPMPPLMFMGEEWASTRPFPFFCDFAGDLAEAVRKGRREEFKHAYAGASDDIPDPLSPETFRSAVLDWNERKNASSRARLDFVHRLLARRKSIMQLFANLRGGEARAECNGNVVTASWRLTNSGRLILVANLQDEATAKPENCVTGMALWGGSVPQELPPWSVYWSMG